MSWLVGLYEVVGGSAIALLLISIMLGIGHDAEIGHGFDQPDGHTDGSDGPSWLSTKVIMGGLIGFGGLGLAASGTALPILATLPVAVVGFVLMAIAVKQFILTPMYRQQSNGLASRDDYLGCTGNIILSVQEGGNGQVRFTDRGLALVTETALSADGKAIPTGTAVIIIEVTPRGLVVDPNPLAK